MRYILRLATRHFMVYLLIFILPSLCKSSVYSHRKHCSSLLNLTAHIIQMRGTDAIFSTCPLSHHVSCSPYSTTVWIMSIGQHSQTGSVHVCQVTDSQENAGNSIIYINMCWFPFKRTYYQVENVIISQRWMHVVKHIDT